MTIRYDFKLVRNKAFRIKLFQYVMSIGEIPMSRSDHKKPAFEKKRRFLNQHQYSWNPYLLILFALSSGNKVSIMEPPQMVPRQPVPTCKLSLLLNKKWNISFYKAIKTLSKISSSYYFVDWKKKKEMKSEI